MPEAAEADIPPAPDDDVVVHRDSQEGGGLRHLARHLDVGARRRRVARGVVVDDN
jgi:hypothetical protein